MIYMKTIAFLMLLSACSFQASETKVEPERPVDELKQRYRVVLYDGGVEIRQWVSSEYPLDRVNGTGIWFRDAETNTIVGINGVFVIERELQ